MNPKPSPQKKTPPTAPLKIVAVERSPQPVELPHEQPLSPSRSTPVEEAASAPRLVSSPPADDSSGQRPAFFQAVGILPGEVLFDEKQTFLRLGQQTYRLFSCPSHKLAFYALRKQIEATGILRQRLIVYPRVTHFPGAQQPHQLAFQLVGFITPELPPQGIQSALGDWEFKLSGLWQFIPVCRLPCLSVFKNFYPQRLDSLKSAPLEKKVQFMKASHLPVLWPDAPVAPFRFNPKLEKEAQGKASFVEIKARFNPQRNRFEFLSLLAVPSGEPPHYLKAAKKDKLELAKTKLAASPSPSHSSLPASDSQAAPKGHRKPKPKKVLQP